MLRLYRSVAIVHQQRHRAQTAGLLFWNYSNQLPASFNASAASYHASTPFAFSRIRRSRDTKATDAVDTATSNSGLPAQSTLSGVHTAVTNEDLFYVAAETLLNKVEVALQPMRHKNDVFIITRSRFGSPCLTIDLKPDDGTYIIEVDTERLRLVFTTPVSGRWVYMLSEATGDWVADPDGHNFEGLLVRDLIKQCQGVPNL